MAEYLQYISNKPEIENYARKETLGIEIQDFRELRQRDCVYVDKTEQISPSVRIVVARK